MPEELNIKSGSITANSLEYYKYTITGKMTDKLFAVYKMNNKNEPIDKCFNRLLKEKLFNKDLGKTAYGNIKNMAIPIGTIGALINGGLNGTVWMYLTLMAIFP
ncbi:hypothetical protein, partial [Pectinatus frisingensis]|uniref:hypothetical protein n=1 Tax=Pectinatus frisingensis TaxID=865 RepID=UPI0018C581BB